MLAARISTLRSVLDTLWEVTAHTGGEPFATIGRAKVELIQLEQELRDRDAAERGQVVSDFARDILTAPLEVQFAAVQAGA